MKPPHENFLRTPLIYMLRICQKSQMNTEYIAVYQKQAYFPQYKPVQTTHSNQ